MSWSHEILRAFLLAFGAMEMFANGSYLVRKNGLELARKQHGELPKEVGEWNIRMKVICMLISGIMFFSTALISYFTHSYEHILFVVCATIFLVYEMIEAFYYKFWKTFGALAVSIVFWVIVYLIN